MERRCMLIFAIYTGLVLLGLLLLGNLFTLVLQDLFIFRPERLAADYPFEFMHPYEEHFLPGPDGGKINGLWFKKGEQPSQKGCILYFHGNKGSLKRWAHLYHVFFRQGYDFFIIDFRGYGKSQGKRSEANMYADALQAYTLVANHYKAAQIVVYGRSMGCAFATYVAAHRPARLLILETPFSSMPDLFRAYFPFLPKLFLFKYHFSNKKYLSKIETPTYIFQGDQDLVVPHAVACKLKPLLKPTDRFYTIEGGRHNNLLHYDLYNLEIARILSPFPGENAK